MPSPGRKVKIKVDLNSVGGAGANWVTIGQQRGGGLSRTSETADATHKDDDGYPRAVITRTPWSISVDGCLNPADPAWAFIHQKWKEKAQPFFQVDRSEIGGSKEEGQCTITDLSEDFPESDLVTFTAELQGEGPLNPSP